MDMGRMSHNDAHHWSTHRGGQRADLGLHSNFFGARLWSWFVSVHVSQSPNAGIAVHAQKVLTTAQVRPHITIRADGHVGAVHNQRSAILGYLVCKGLGRTCGGGRGGNTHARRGGGGLQYRSQPQNILRKRLFIT